MQLLGTLRAKTATWLLMLLLAHNAVARFWTVTSYYMQSVWTSGYSTYTTTYEVKKGVTPTVSPYSTTTWDYTYNDLTEMAAYLPAGAVADSDLVTTLNTLDGTSSVFTYYVVAITYTAPASCPTPFTVETFRSVDVPSKVTDSVTPTSFKTSTESTFTYVEAFVPASAVPPPSTTTTDFVESYYVRSCLNPTATYGLGSGSSSGGDGSSSGGGSTWDWEVCSALTGCTSLAIWIIVVATILPVLFLFGFLESWFWFRNLMIGKSALRFGTICWICLSLWILCFTRHTPPRSPADQERLRQQWKSMSGGTKFKLWWTWGFRHAYPTALLGPDPKNPMGPGADAAVMTMQMPPPGAGGPGEKGQVYAAPQQGQYQYGYPPVQYQYGPPPPGQEQFVPQGQQPYQMPPPGQQPYPMPPPGQQMYGPPPPGMQPMYGPPPTDQQKSFGETQVSPVGTTPTPPPLHYQQQQQQPPPPQQSQVASPSSELAATEHTTTESSVLRGSEVNNPAQRHDGP